MKIYLTSDTHFGHDKLVELSGRPPDFGEKILDSVGQSRGDLLIHCGDFCIGNDEAHLMRFKNHAAGFKKVILVRGNHDNKSDSWYLERGFDFVCDSFTAKYFGKRYIFTHMPIVKNTAFDRNIHGHLHGNGHHASEFDHIAYDPNWHYDLAPELHNYKVISMEQIVSEPVDSVLLQSVV